MKRALGVFEHTQAFANAHFPFNVVVVLRLMGAPAVETLQRACELLRCHHPLLGVGIHTIDGRLCFDTDGVPPMPFRALPRRSEQDWRTLAEEELDSSFDLTTGPLLRAAYLGPEGAEGRAELVLTFQHVIMDAASGTSLIAELLGLCADLEAGRSLQEVQLQPFPPAAEERFTASMKRGRSGFVLRQLADEVNYQWHSRGKRQPPVYAQGRSRILSLQLPEQVTADLVQRCRRQRVTLNSALAAALLLVAQRRLYGGEERLLRNFVFANLRPYVVPPLAADNLGSCFAMLRLTTQVPKDADFWNLAQMLNAQIYQAAKRGEKYHNLLMSRSVMKMMLGQNRFRMAHTALSYTGVANLPVDYDGLRLTGLHAFVSNFVLSPEYTAQVRMFAGRLWWDFVYLDCDMGAQQAEVLAQEILMLLEEKAHVGGS
jgi:hypothetical protein